MKNIINTATTQIEKELSEQNMESLNILIDAKENLSEVNLANILANIFNLNNKINFEFIEALIENGVAIKSKTNNGLSAFLLAVYFGNHVLTKLFLDKGADVNEENIYYSERESCSLGALDPKYYKQIKLTPFMFIFENYNSENIKLLIENGANVNTYIYQFDSILIGNLAYKVALGNTALSRAVLKEDISLVKLLLTYGADIKLINCDFSRIIHTSSHFDMLKVLIAAGLDVNKDFGSIQRTTLLMLCAEYSSVHPTSDYDDKTTIYVEIAKYLLKHGADINDGSPLMISLSQKIESNQVSINFPMVKFLIANGGDVNYTLHGNSVLMKAMEIGSRDIVQLLIKHGADVNCANNDGRTVLMQIHGLLEETYLLTEANIYPSEERLNLLLDNGAEINRRDNQGMTALMHYAYSGYSKLVQILLDRGADINIKSEMTAFDLGNDEIKSIIKSTQNNNPQKLVKLLSNFTIDKPIKFTTHIWDFGSLNDEYVNFEGYLNAVKKQFQLMSTDLEQLSPRLYKKIYTFLLEENPDKNYSWCSKTDINLGWSSLEGLQEWSDNGNNPFEFKLQKSYIVEDKMITKFGEVVELFKQEIEIRKELNNLENIFISISENLNSKFQVQMNKLGKQFYTDTEALSSTLYKIFSEIQKRENYPNIEVTATLPESEYIELRIVQIDSLPQTDVQSLLKEVKNGDFADIKSNLTNLCDWAIEGAFENEYFRINYLKSNNLKDIERLEQAPKGFTHILRFYI